MIILSVCIDIHTQCIEKKSKTNHLNIIAPNQGYLCIKSKPGWLPWISWYPYCTHIPAKSDQYSYGINNTICCLTAEYITDYCQNKYNNRKHTTKAGSNPSAITDNLRHIFIQSVQNIEYSHIAQYCT